jgi:O-antigen/teichoic acid export membrane protein
LVREVLGSLFLLTLFLFKERKKFIFPRVQVLSAGLIQLKKDSVYFKDLYVQKFLELSHTRGIILTGQSLLNNTQLGFFSQALYLVNVANRMLSSLIQQIALVYFRWSSGDKIGMRKGNLVGYSSIIVLCLPIVYSLSYFPEDVLFFLWGDKWIGAEPFLRKMSVLIMMIPLFTMKKAKLIALDKVRYISLGYFIGVLVLLLPMLGVGDRGDFPAFVVASFTLPYLFIEIVGIFIHEEKKN